MEKTAEIANSDTQISLADYIDSRRDATRDLWEVWRNAQALDDSAKALVDEVFTEYLQLLDKLYDNLVPF